MTGSKTLLLEEACNVEYGTRVVQKRDGGSIYPVYGGGGATFKMDVFNRENRFVIARFGMSEGCTRFVTGKFFLNDSGLTVSPKNETVDQRFLDYQLLFKNDDIFALGKGAAQKNLDVPAFREMPLCVPNRIEEQHRIVAILDEAFAGLATAKANAKKNLQNAREIFESHLQSLFIPRGSGSVEKPLAQICTFSSGGTPDKSNSSYWSGEIPWVSGRDMKSTRLSDSALHVSQSAVDESSTRMSPAGTLLILVRGMGLAHGAQIAELMVPCAFNQDIRGIHPKSEMLPRYLLFAVRNRINSSSKVMSNAAHGTLKIDSDGLKSLMIPVPSYEQQKRVVTKIDRLAEESQRLESIYTRKLAALDDLKKSLLHQAFSGQL